MHRCEYCNKKVAEAVLLDETEYIFKYICEDCLQELRKSFGDFNLNYQYLMAPYQAVDWLKNEANKLIMWLRGRVV